MQTPRPALLLFALTLATCSSAHHAQFTIAPSTPTDHTLQRETVLLAVRALHPNLQSAPIDNPYTHFLLCNKNDPRLASANPDDLLPLPIGTHILLISTDYTDDDDSFLEKETLISTLRLHITAPNWPHDLTAAYNHAYPALHFTHNTTLLTPPPWEPSTTPTPYQRPGH